MQVQHPRFNAVSLQCMQRPQCLQLPKCPEGAWLLNANDVSPQSSTSKVNHVVAAAAQKKKRQNTIHIIAA